MNRRQFLRMRTGGEPVLEVSCQHLYMRYVDARLHGDPAEPFRWLERRLRGVSALRLSDGAWLASEDLERMMEPVLASFRVRGGRVQVE
jgi:hypothetical protein